LPDITCLNWFLIPHTCKKTYSNENSHTKVYFTRFFIFPFMPLLLKNWPHCSIRILDWKANKRSWWLYHSHLQEFVSFNWTFVKHISSSLLQTMGIFKIISVTWSDFCSKTSIGGLCNVGFTNSFIRKTYWLVVFTILSMITLPSFRATITSYLEYQVVTNTELTYRSNINFPAVTICNFNRLYLYGFRKILKNA